MARRPPVRTCSADDAKPCQPDEARAPGPSRAIPLRLRLVDPIVDGRSARPCASRLPSALGASLLTDDRRLGG
jgi:hypothetical protein